MGALQVWSAAAETTVPGQSAIPFTPTAADRMIGPGAPVQEVEGGLLIPVPGLYLVNAHFVGGFNNIVQPAGQAYVRIITEITTSVWEGSGT